MCTKCALFTKLQIRRFDFAKLSFCAKFTTFILCYVWEGWFFPYHNPHLRGSLVFPFIPLLIVYLCASSVVLFNVNPNPGGLYFGPKTIFPPPLLKMIFFPPLTIRRFTTPIVVFLPSFFPILHLFYSFTSPFLIFFPLSFFCPFSSFFFYIFPFFSSPFHIFSPKWHRLIFYPPPGGGRGYFPTYRPLSKS